MTGAYRDTPEDEDMRIMHTSDLHLGKRLHEMPLTEDQRHMLDELVRIASEERPDVLIVAGDVFDRTVPPEESVSMFGDFLTRVSDVVPTVAVIAGNHDSGARLGYCAGLLERSGVHVAGAFEGRMERLVVSDGTGSVDLWLLPYFRVSEVRAVADRPIADYADAMGWILDTSDVDPSRTNVLVAHQFMIGRTPPETSGSEDQVPDVGGLSYIPADLLGDFDYVALGHLHLPQSVGRPAVRYSGSPLKYSASESLSGKSVTIVELHGKDEADLRTVPIEPLHDVRVLRGTVGDIVDAAPREGREREDYVYVTLTERPTGVDEIRRAYPNVLQIAVETDEGSGPLPEVPREVIARESPGALFSRFFEEMTGRPLSERQLRILGECSVDGRDAE